MVVAMGHMLVRDGDVECLKGAIANQSDEALRFVEARTGA
jgi:hypothetical protein